MRFRLIILGCGLSSFAWGQFGGRDGDTVIYTMTSKGPADFRVVPGAVNSVAALARFAQVDPASVEAVPIEQGFPKEFVKQMLHEEPDDIFHLLTQHEGLPGPHRIYRTSYKVFLFNGLVRETEVVIDSTAALATTLKEGANFGPDEALSTFQVLFWGNRAQPFPDVDLVPIGTIGPKVPPGLTGDEWIRTFGRVPYFIPWENARRKFPNAGWFYGVDFKVIDKDAEMGSHSHLIRFRPGARTPRFQITGATHLFVLQGALELNVPGLGIVRIGDRQYAFLPPGLAVEIYNPRAPRN